jgi:arginyl-tRNA--protein-N-Asp/Glu arginylyltransferase
MARSVRSDIQNWTPTSENRRVLRKFDDGFTKISRKVTDIRHDESFFALCLSYFNLAHGSAMPRERLEYILDSGLINRVIEYKKDDAIIAYLLPVEGEDFAHYWFSFYKEEYSKTALGMWLALDYIREAQQNNIQYFYFGTCYQEKALYKTNVEPLEYWNGSKWSNDIKTLKALCRSDQERTIDSHKDIYKASLSLF